MNKSSDLFSHPDFRKFMLKACSSLGYRNIVLSLMKGITSAKGDRKKVISTFMQSAFKRLGKRVAVSTETENITFDELQQRSVKLANSLHQQGISKGDRIAVLMDNEAAWFTTMFACMLTGLKMPMLNTHLNQKELRNCIQSCAPKALIFSPGFAPVIQELEAELESVAVFVCTQPIKLPNSYHILKDLVTQGAAEIPFSGFGLAQMPFSGGSSGQPKFISESDVDADKNPRMQGINEKELQTLKLNYIAGYSRLGLGDLKGDMKSLVPGPLYHSGPQIAVLPLYLGGTVAVMSKFDAEDFLKTIQEKKINFTFVAPTMLERIIKLPESIKTKYDLSSMRIILCAGAPCPHFVKSQINKLFIQQGASVNVFNEYYGSSEAQLISVLRASDYEQNPERYKSVGKATVSETRVYDMTEKSWCEPGEIGHVLVRNPRIYRVQAGNTNEISKSLIQVEGTYWYDDGCVGYLDADQFLYLTSRSKDMIISGGVNIFPNEIEEAIKTHPAVQDAAVVKVADEDLGEVPGAVVELIKGQRLDHIALIDHCKSEGLYGFKIPRHVRFTEKLPKNDAGKIRKSELEMAYFRSEETVAEGA